MNELFQSLIILLKIAVPASMLKFPILGLWGNYFLDVDLSLLFFGFSGGNKLLEML